jgi:hypothetical protein
LGVLVHELGEDLFLALTLGFELLVLCVLAPALPVTRVVLYSSGVGYFQRDGEFNGNTAVSLHFHANQINDLLKTLIVAGPRRRASAVRPASRF